MLAAVRFWPEQLLSGRARAVRLHRGLRSERDLHRVAQGARAPVAVHVDFVLYTRCYCTFTACRLTFRLVPL